MELHHVCVVAPDPIYEQRRPTWIVYVSVLPTLCSNSTSGGKPIAFAIALSISKPGFSILPLRSFRHLRASHDASAGLVEIPPAPSATVRAAIDL